MKKFLRNSLFGTLLVVSATAVSGCGRTQTTRCGFDYQEEHGKVEFWSSFGAGYTSILDGIVNDIRADETLNLDIKHVDHGSYDKIKTDMMSSIIVGDYPNVCVGYPDHFAEYIGNGVITPLDYYIDLYKQETGIDLLDSNVGYYDAYMTENKGLDIDCEGKPVISALPFNKSTELMGYNGVFVDYCVDWCNKNPNVEVNGVKASTWNLGVVPETWQEWSIKGAYYKYIMDTLTMVKNVSGAVITKGKLVYGVQNYEGTASDFEVIESDLNADPEETRGNRTLLLNFKNVEKADSRVIAWDATDNMFITLIRQWGSEYTVLPDDQKTEDPFYRVGKILFNSSKNRATTIKCLKYFSDLYQRGIFGVPQTFGASYSSDAFAANQVMFMLCSSGGLSYNTAQWRNRFRVAHLPYYKDVEGGQTVVRKYVISQGANLAMTDAGSRDDAFRFIVELTTGQHQIDWCLKTGYYPASKAAADSTQYQAFLNQVQTETQNGTPEKAYQKADGSPDSTRVAYREGSEINADYYMPEGAHYNDEGAPWHKFVDDAFIGSSDIRDAVKVIFKTIFSFSASEAANDDKYGTLLDDVCKAFNNNDNVEVER